MHNYHFIPIDIRQISSPDCSKFAQSTYYTYLQVLSVSSDFVTNGLVFGFFGDANEDLNEENTKNLSINEYENINDRDTPVSAAVIIHPDILGDVTEGNIALTIYQDDSLFVSNNKKQNEIDKTDGNFTINTNVISISIGQTEDTGRKLAIPLKISLAHKQVRNF